MLGQSLNSSDGYLALLGATIHVSPTDEPIRDGVVLIQAPKIAAVGSRALVRVPQSARVLDCSGLTITAGFWNSHVHFFERKWADAATIPAPELSRQLQDMLTQYGLPACSTSGPCGRIRGGFATASSLVKCPDRESARRGRAWFPREPSHRSKFSTSWAL